jgi:hypothetical protein
LVKGRGIDKRGCAPLGHPLFGRGKGILRGVSPFFLLLPLSCGTPCQERGTQGVRKISLSGISIVYDN